MLQIVLLGWKVFTKVNMSQLCMTDQHCNNVDAEAWR